MRTVETVLFLVIVATIVATFARRLRIPAPSLLVVVGVVVGLVPGVPEVEVTPELVSLVVLPPLLFAAGEELAWRDLRSVWRPVTGLAVGLVLVSAVAVGAVAVALTSVPVGTAFVLGAVLASTDPVAVAALGRRLSLPPRVQALVQAESLFNDATSLLLFRVALSLAVTTGAVRWGDTIAEFVVLAGGGILVGGLAAGGAFLIRRRTEDPVLESVLSLLTPYTAFVGAEMLHGSGVTAVVIASVILGTQATRLTTAPIRLQLGAVSGTVVFLLESVVFGLIGLQLPGLVRRLSEAGSGTAWLLPALAITAVLLAVRLLWIFPLAAIAQGRRGVRPSWPVPAVVTWAGTRGVVPLAAALSIPLALPGRDLVLALSIGVIVITLVVQGFTLAPLVRRAGIALDPSDVDREHASARARLAEAALVRLDELADTETAPEFVVDQLRRSWRARLDRIMEDEAEQASETPSAGAYRELRRELLTVEGTELNRLYEAGAITDATRRRIQRTLDLEGLGDG